ncbi:phosphoheptose isomerase [Algoriphagus limi]|uniref:Phosphoheptose isomerase n=1 Tax=Algoriphagus limi TaxID=2975273 RepID=A0ABT2G7P2_9BACT|nr:phosphoheptose isomerase [Algoriphagus limi]MCS5489952.1 phosphoheptose isomerase [Algoriphagus limi]
MNELLFSPTSPKDQVFQQVLEYLESEGFSIVSQDRDRPWGGFFVIDEQQIKKFHDVFFPDVPFTEEQYAQKLSPKFLLVAPDARLSWQYHFRRAEIWKLLFGEAGIVRSMTDEIGEERSMAKGKTVKLSQGERHRLVGKNNWGVVAEIWMHTDPLNPSDESDIVRLQDDYSRK